MKRRFELAGKVLMNSRNKTPNTINGGKRVPPVGSEVPARKNQKLVPKAPSPDFLPAGTAVDKTVRDYMEEFPLGAEPASLSLATPHELDDSIKFDEESHTYFVNYNDREAPRKEEDFSSEGNVSVSGIVPVLFDDRRRNQRGLEK